MPHDARAIANFILDRSDDRGRPLTQLALLKVLYFSHAWYGVHFGRTLVHQPFEAWRYGPVVRVVYEQTKGFGAGFVTGRLTRFDIASGSERRAEAHLPDVEQAFLRSVVDAYAALDGLRLSDLTHEPGSPWDKVWKRSETVAVPGMVIDNRDIVEWFATTGARAVVQAAGAAADDAIAVAARR